MNSLYGWFFKLFKTLAVRALSDIKHSSCALVILYLIKHSCRVLNST